jgi:hypothetical protein
MDLSNLRNPHIAALAPQEDCGVSAEPVVAPMRLRVVTLSPAEEYVRREGVTEAIPDALVALILSRKTRVQVTMAGVKITEGKVKRVYWHPDSPLCNRIGDGETLRVFAVWNRQDDSRIHLMSDDGRYLETLPEKGKAAWFDHEQGAKIIADSRRAITRVYHHLQSVHEGESITAVERAQRNKEAAETVLRATMNFEAPQAAATGRTAEESPALAALERANRGTAEAQATAAETRRAADAHFDRPVAPARELSPALQRADVYDPFDV